MTRTYLRVPLVRRVEYLVAFLESYIDSEFDEKHALKAVQQRIHLFEIQKAKALGRQRPQMRKGASTLKECIALARHLGFVDQSMHLRPDARKVLDPESRRHTLLERMWQIYPRFKQVVMGVRDAERLDLSFYGRGDAFRQEALPLYGFDFNQVIFEIVRDLATELNLINWHPTEGKRHIVYPVASVSTYAEMFSLAGLPVVEGTFAQRCQHQTALDLSLLTVAEGRYQAQAHLEQEDNGYLVLQSGSDRVYIKDHWAATEDFEQTLWEEYLTLSNMRPRFPVLYPNLRNRVCASLLLSDRAFDQCLLTLIRKPQRLNIYPSGGVLNYAANLAHLGKFLPPQTSKGNFIVYLKIERRSDK